MSSIGIAASLYTVRQLAARDLPGALAAVKSAGFDFVHWSGMPDLPATDVRRVLDSAGLKAVGAHCPAEWLEENFEGAVAYWETVGTPDIAVGGMMLGSRSSIEAWREGCRRLDALGARLADRDIRLSYHNHAFELEHFPGDTRNKLEILLESCAPQHLSFELDTGWLYAAGEDPAQWLRRLAGRCPLVQMQDARIDDNAEPAFVPLGEGALDWEDLFDAGEEAAVEWYIYKQEHHAGKLLEDLAASYTFLADRA